MIDNESALAHGLRRVAARCKKKLRKAKKMKMQVKYTTDPQREVNWTYAVVDVNDPDTLRVAYPLDDIDPNELDRKIKGAYTDAELDELYLNEDDFFAAKKNVGKRTVGNGHWQIVCLLTIGGRDYRLTATTDDERVIESYDLMLTRVWDCNSTCDEIDGVNDRWMTIDCNRDFWSHGMRPLFD